MKLIYFPFRTDPGEIYPDGRPHSNRDNGVYCSGPPYVQVSEECIQQNRE